jgi:hypothetical protein
MTERELTPRDSAAAGALPDARKSWVTTERRVIGITGLCSR